MTNAGDFNKTIFMIINEYTDYVLFNDLNFITFLVAVINYIRIYS